MRFGNANSARKAICVQKLDSVKFELLLQVFWTLNRIFISIEFGIIG